MSTKKIKRNLQPAGSPFPFARSVEAGGYLHVSGQLPINSEGKLLNGDIKEQTEQVIENIKRELADGGYGIEDVVKVSVWLQSKADFAGFNEVFVRHFADAPPARVTVVSELVVDAKIEIDALAYLEK